MTAGYVDRTLLASNYQNPGDVYDDSKTEGALKVLADQNDANWDYVGSLVAGGTLQPYPAFLSRQALINGNFDVWQRGTSFTTTVSWSRLLADRWYLYVDPGTGTLPSITWSQLTLTPGDLLNSYYAYRISPNGAGTGLSANSYQINRQKIEFGTRYLCGSGKKITVSFYARSSITGKKIGVAISQNYGTGGSPSTGDQLTGTNFTLSSNWTKYTYTVSTASLTGKVFGTNNDDYIGLDFFTMWGSTYQGNVGASTPETFGASGTIDIAQVQLNAGDQALPFQPRSFAEELALCQRYYEKSYDIGAVPGTNVGSGIYSIRSRDAVAASAAGAVRGVNIFYKARKRNDGTVTLYSVNGTSGAVRKNESATDRTGCTATNLAETGFSSINMNNSSATAIALDDVIDFHWTCDAEL